MTQLKVYLKKLKEKHWQLKLRFSLKLKTFHQGMMKLKYTARKYRLLIVFECLILTNVSVNMIHTQEQIVVNLIFEQT